MDYNKSVELALFLGYKKVLDDNAFNGCYFIKDDKKWIHDVVALKKRLGVKLDKDLEDLGYDLGNYHSYKNYSNEMAIQEMQSLYEAIAHCEGKATYLSDGMWLLPNGTIEER